MGAPTFLDLARSIDPLLAGNMNFSFRAVADGATSITANDTYISVDATANDATLTLPSAVTVKKGMGFWLVRIDDQLDNTVVIGTTGGQTINGAATTSLGVQYATTFIMSNGTNWLLYASPASFALASDVLWTFSGQISTDQNTSIFELVAKKSMSFVAVDANVRIAPAGSSILVDWAINGVIDPALQTEITAASTYGETVFAFSLEVDDTLRPVISQVGSQTPGQTMVMRARGQ